MMRRGQIKQVKSCFTNGNDEMDEMKVKSGLQASSMFVALQRLASRKE